MSDIEKIALEVAEETAGEQHGKYCFTLDPTKFTKALLARLAQDVKPFRLVDPPFDIRPLFLHPPLTQQVPERGSIENEAIIEALRAQLKDTQAHERVAHMRYAEAADEIESLRAELSAAQAMNTSLTGELAECQKERDLMRKQSAWEAEKREGHYEHRAELENELIAAEARIAELVEGLKKFCDCKSDRDLLLVAVAAVKLLSRTDNLEALRVYRNQVIEECVEAGRKASLTRYASPMFVEQCSYNREQMVEAIRALKKGNP